MANPPSVGQGWPQRAWPHLRAALILTHVVAVVALALPHPGQVTNRSQWTSSRGRMELASWTSTLNRVGYEISESELEDRAWAWATGYAEWHRRWLAPFDAYNRYFHVRQEWSMFTHPKKRVGRIWIEIERDGAFVPVFISKSPQHTWLEDVLTHNRMRKLFNRVTSHRYKAGLLEFALWIAPRIARDFPRAPRARVRIENYLTPSAEEVQRGFTPSGTFTRSRLIDLEALR